MNDRIRSPEVRVVGPQGEQWGVMATEIAISRAASLDFDLVEVAPQAEPPVCKVMDYGKYRYEQDIKAKEARKRQQGQAIKGMRFQIKISAHDFETKKNQMRKFLESGSKVKVSLRFRGREMQHSKLGHEMLTKLGQQLSDVSIIEVQPKVDGRSMIMVFGPLRREQRKKDAENENPQGNRQEVSQDRHGQT